VKRVYKKWNRKRGKVQGEINSFLLATHKRDDFSDGKIESPVGGCG
jgi:hypothetical protein